MIAEKFILASSETLYEGVVVETIMQWKQGERNNFTFVFFQYNNGKMITRIKMMFK
jgi:hypothetical protein